ncbi:MAG: nucleotidyltransferase family protein [Rhodobiaceae bacterium]|nr:nucleotidyltransferase family protein [Rhodobiaceae bacterium]MCC0018166.1 nucleotidyltransferase family protein [Rhodobiaceae bacterium]MCC0051268.1 nucleotidyltransferase family protein [Rhodobiaceae bacterium]MCC0053097.1 nucleotidyltransferase family protein [Rhodobiaceae bacterium]
MTGNRHLDEILCALADPEMETVAVPGNLLPVLVDKARAHGVAPVVLRKLAESQDSIALDDMRLDVEACIIMTLKLRLLAEQITRFVEDNDLEATIVKGPVFAETLYANRGDRPFTDLDLLCADDARLRLREHLTDAGFVHATRPVFDRSDIRQEEKWARGSGPQLVVELHGNLVHYPALRRRTSFSYADMMRIGGSDPKAPLCLFFTAVAHAALGHKFHHLRLLVDVLQAFRNLDEAARGTIADMARQTRLRIETASCLRLIAELFGEDDALEVARRVVQGLTWKLSASLLTARSVLDAPEGALSRVRRHGFRFVQMTVGR